MICPSCADGDYTRNEKGEVYKTKCTKCGFGITWGKETPKK